MSYLAIGATTQALVELLTRKLNKPALLGSNATFTISTLPPDDDRVGENTGLNIYLYRIVESPFHKNMDWRGSPSSPDGARRPALTVTLNYLLTAYTKKIASSFRDDITAHQLLGNAMSILHDYPVLNDIHDADFDADVDVQFAPELRDSFEKLKVTLLPASLDEFSKIWTGFAKAYRLSMAYEVSLVQLPPLTGREAPRPRPQRAVLQVTTLGPPLLLSVDPAAAAVGDPIQLKGVDFSGPGRATAVFVGETRVDQESFSSLSADTIVFALPSILSSGPTTNISVERDGQRSAPLAFRIRPWIAGLSPVRGVAGIPTRFSCQVPSGQSVSVTVGGVSAPAAFDASSNTVTATIPAASASGAKPLVATVSGPPARSSNALSFEVLPSITSVALTTSATPASSTVTITGEGLSGTEVEVNYGGLLVTKRANGDFSQIQVTVDRILATNVPVSVLVDGSKSPVFHPS